MELISVNAGKVRRATLNGRRFLVATLSMIVEGVLAGSKGRLHYPGEEISRSAQAWNGMPITVYHPQVNGLHVSARHPDIASTQQVGTVYNANTVRLKDGRIKLRAEGWFDEELTRRVDNRVYDALIHNRPLEISTGLFTENIAEPGVYNGRSYDYVARSYMPDHLAVLPDQVGACALSDGCGLNVNQAGHDAPSASESAKAEKEEECHCGGKCEECATRAATSKGSTLNVGRFGNPQCGDTGRFLSHGSGTGKGEQHQAAVQGYKTVQEAAEEGNDSDEDYIDPDRPELWPFCKRVSNQGGLVGSPRLNGRRSVRTTAKEQSMALTEGKRAELIQWITTNCDCWKGRDDAETLNQFTDGKLIEIAKAADKSRQQELALNAAAKPIRIGKTTVRFDAAKGRYVVNAAKPNGVAPSVPGLAKAVANPEETAVTAEEGMAEQEEGEEVHEEEEVSPGKKKTVPVVGNVRKAVNLAEWFLMAPPEAGADPEATWNSAVLGQKRKRAEIIKVLTDHLDGERRQFAINQLNKKSMADLELDLLIKGPRMPQFVPQQPFGAERDPVANYEGAGGPPIYNNGPEDDDPIPIPSAIDSAIAFNRQQHKSKYRDQLADLEEVA